METDYKLLERRYNSLVEAVEALEKKDKKLVEENTFLKTQIENANKNVAIQKKIVIDNIMQSEDIKHNLEDEIMALRKELKKVKNLVM